MAGPRGRRRHRSMVEPSSSPSVRAESASLASGRHRLRPLDEPDRLGGIAGGVDVLRHLGAAAAGVSGRRRHLCPGGPTRDVATSAGRRAGAATDFRGQGAGEPQHHRVARGWTRLFGHRRRTGGGRRPAVGGPGRAPPHGRAGGPCGAARLADRPRANAGLRGDRAARLGSVRPFSDGTGDPRAARL